MPYLLPVDPAVSELGCVLVFYPNAAEYRQALFGQLAELSDVWNWEGTREAQALARAAWLSAELETINNMTCLDELLAEVQAINAKLPWCCEDGTGYSEGVEGGGGTVVIWPTPGPAPLPIPDTDFSTDDYPVTPGTDPDDGGTVSEADWEQYLCGAANYLVDSLIDYFRFVRFQRSFTSSFLGVIRWLQARLAGAIIPGLADDFALWELNDLLDTVIGAFEDVPITVLDAAISDLESLRENIVCAILGEDVAQNAIDAALTVIFGSIDNALAQSLIGNPVALFASLIWNGALDVDWRDDCECTEQLTTTAAVFRIDSLTSVGEGTPSNDRFVVQTNPLFTTTAADASHTFPRYVMFAPAGGIAAWTGPTIDFTDGRVLHSTGWRLSTRDLGAAGTLDELVVTVLATWDGTDWLDVEGLDVIAYAEGGSASTISISGNTITWTNPAGEYEFVYVLPRVSAF